MIHDELSQVIILAIVMVKFSPIPNPKEEIFDLSWIGISERTVEDLEPYYRGEAEKQAKRRFTGVLNFVNDRLHRKLEPMPNMDKGSLTQAMGFMYAFGAIDQVKTSINLHIKNILSQVK